MRSSNASTALRNSPAPRCEGRRGDAVRGPHRRTAGRRGHAIYGTLQPRPDTDPAVIVQGKIRLTPRGWVITVFFVNTQPEQDRKKDEAWVFQPKMWVLDAAVPPQPIIIQRRDWQHDLTRMDAITREETETLEMLYRHRLEFAVGHGASVHVTLPAPEATKAMMVETEFVPRSEVEQQTPPTPADDTNLTGVVLDMKELAQMPKADLLATLRKLKDAYASWIQKESGKISIPTERLADHQVAAQRATTNCQRACTRIAEGIDLIENDPLAEGRPENSQKRN